MNYCWTIQPARALNHPLERRRKAARNFVTASPEVRTLNDIWVCRKCVRICMSHNWSLLRNRKIYATCVSPQRTRLYQEHLVIDLLAWEELKPLRQRAVSYAPVNDLFWEMLDYRIIFLPISRPSGIGKLPDASGGWLSLYRYRWSRRGLICSTHFQ